MTDCSALPTVEDSELFKQDAGTINEVVTSPDNYTSPASDGLPKKTLAGIVADAAAATAALDDIRYSKLDNPLTHILKKNKLVDTLEGDLTWTRASTATYTDMYGVIQTATIDEPRQEQEGWLIEGESTNLALWSEDFTNSVWETTSLTATLDNTAGTPISGGSAYKLVADAGTNSVRLRQSLTYLDATPYTLSCYAKAGEWNFATIFFGGADFGYTGSSTTVNLTTGEKVGGSSSYVTVQTLSDGWFKISVSTTTTAGGTSSVIAIVPQPTSSSSVNAVEGDGVSGIYVTGVQLEELSFATSYIPTTDAAATRARDDASIAFTGNMTFDSKSVSCNFDYFGALPANNAALFDTDGVNDARLQVTTSSQLITRHANNGVSIPVTPNTDYLGVLTYDSQTGELTTFTNSEYSSNTNGEDLSSDNTTINIGNLTTGSAPSLYGHIQDFRIYDFALNEAEVSFLAGE